MRWRNVSRLGSAIAERAEATFILDDVFPLTPALSPLREEGEAAAGFVGSMRDIPFRGVSSVGQAPIRV